MVKKQTFPFDPSQFGNKWLGKVTQFREMTAAEFDEIRSASLSERIGGDAAIMYLETEDVHNPEQGRATFFTLDTRPVSKWARFIKSLKENCDIIIKGGQDLVGRVLYFEEREQEMGKRGKQTIWEAVGIPSPDEIAALTREEVKATGEGEAPAAPVVAEEKSDDYLKELILGVADGLTRAEVSKELTDMGVNEPEDRIRSLSTQLIAAGKLTFKDGRFTLVEE